ncbi:MAG: hypothetical protein AMJ79_16130, partial [Phycisphaerae bacterium SM23_30]
MYPHYLFKSGFCASVLVILGFYPLFCSAQTMTFNGSGTSWNVAGHWTPANVPDTAGESAYVPDTLVNPFLNLNMSPAIDWLTLDNSSATFYLNNYTLTIYQSQGFTNSGSTHANNVTATINGIVTNTVSGQINIWGGKRLYLKGPMITNNGVITVNSDVGAGNTYLIFTDDILFNGSGDLVLSDTIYNFVQGQVNTHRLTNAAGHTIRGSHHLGNNSMALTNQGLIQADQSLPLIIDPTDNQTVFNSGIMQANGGT